MATKKEGTRKEHKIMVISLDNGLALIQNGKLITSQFQIDEVMMIRKLDKIIELYPRDTCYGIFRRAVKEILGFSLYQDNLENKYCFKGKNYSIHDSDYFLKYRQAIETNDIIVARNKKTLEKRKKVEQFKKEDRHEDEQIKGYIREVTQKSRNYNYRHKIGK